METEAALRPEAVFDLACFEVGSQTYAIDVAQVKEIARLQEITHLPKAPELIEGVIDLRGVLLPVVDLARVLGDAVAAGGPRGRIAVVEVDDLLLGLRVDAAVDVLEVEASAIEEAPPLATHAGYDAVRAIVRRPGGSPVLVVSLEHVLESVYRSAERSGAAA